MGAYDPALSGNSGERLFDESWADFYQNSASAPANPGASNGFSSTKIWFNPILNRWNAPPPWSRQPTNPPAGQERYVLSCLAIKAAGVWQTPIITGPTQDTNNGLGRQFSTDGGATWIAVPASGILPSGATHERTYDPTINAWGNPRPLGAARQDPVILIPESTIPSNVGNPSNAILNMNFNFRAFHTYHLSGEWTRTGRNPRKWFKAVGQDFWATDANGKHWFLIDERGVDINRFPRSEQIAGPLTAFRAEQSGTPDIRYHWVFNARAGAEMSLSLKMEGIPVEAS